MKRLASKEGGKVGSGRRPAGGDTALRPWTGVGGCLGGIPRPCILPLSPPSRATRCPKRYAAPTSAHSETPRQPSRASPRSRCSQRGAIPLPARHRDHVRYARNEQRVRDKHQSASMHHLHVKRAFDPRSDRARKAALHVPSAAARAARAARMPRNHSDAATASAERAGGGVRPQSYLCTISWANIYSIAGSAALPAPSGGSWAG